MCIGSEPVTGKWMLLLCIVYAYRIYSTNTATYTLHVIII